MALKTTSLVGKVLLVVVGVAGTMVCAGNAVAQKGARPCDVIGAATPCVDAISTTRALYAAYRGPLYEVTRASDKLAIKIGVTAGGYGDADMQDEFCKGTTCTITKIYDQSPKHNDLTLAPPGGAAKGPGPGGYDIAAVANALPAMLNGHKVYGIAILPGMGYRNDSPKGTAVNGQAEGVYMVTSALNLNGKCCFDYGNAEVNNLDNDKGHMDAINIMCNGDPCKPDAGLDMENGIYGHLNVPVSNVFATDIGVCDGQKKYAIYQGNAQGGELTSTGMIDLPKGYTPMLQEGAIILGIGGDNSNSAKGYFFEGVMTMGVPAQGVLEALQKNIVAAKYAGELPRS
jgi:hypothetical protein